jgi:hypothetical protein
MRVPKRISRWGREYVGQWVAKDRAAGLRIDPRVEAYVAGQLGPYEPLREVPSTWRTFKSQPYPLARRAWHSFARGCQQFFSDGRLKRELGSLAEYAWSWFCLGSGLSYWALFMGGAKLISPELAAVVKVGEPSLREVFVAGVGGLVIADAALLVRTARA